MFMMLFMVFMMIHRDLKSGNVLEDIDNRGKVCDFGLSGFQAVGMSHMTAVQGTAAWSAPESLTEARVHPSIDVYSFGVILWELVTGNQPWRGSISMQLLTQIVVLKRSLELPPDEVTSDLGRLILQCFVADPSQRPTFDDCFARLSAILSAQVIIERQVPDAFICPISYEVMTDPVILADGFTYERAVIQQWLASTNRSPMTNQELEHRGMIPNRALRDVIRGVVGERGSMAVAGAGGGSITSI